MPALKKPTRKGKRWMDFQAAAEDARPAGMQYVFTMEVVIRPEDLCQRELEDALEYLRSHGSAEITDCEIIQRPDPRVL